MVKGHRTIEEVSCLQKIAIIGSAGAGKSTLAKKIAQKTGIPLYHLDALYWQPGWVATERSQWRKVQEVLCSQERWILDGNYGSTLDIRLAHSDTIIVLDVNRFVCVLRVLWRSFSTYGQNRSDMAQGCQEQFDWAFLKWIWNFPKKGKPQLLQHLNQLPPDKTVLILRSNKEIKAFLETLANQKL
jgi:adenylate kinase family enzyme